VSCRSSFKSSRPLSNVSPFCWLSRHR
jgi:hypothetical protein